MAIIDADELPWLIDINVFMTAISEVDWAYLGVDTPAIRTGYRQSNPANQNAEVNYDVCLAAGTWTVEVMHMTSAGSGIYSVQFDGIEKGTIDGYSGSNVYNVRSSVAGITVSATGKVRLKLKMATKNASSSGYTARVTHIQLRRTA